jgi:hypothetical protein
MTAAQHGEDSKKSRKRKKRGGLGGWLTSFSGILASVATIVAAIASLFAAHQTSKVNQLTIVVHQQQRQIAQAASHGSTAPSPAASSGSSGGAPPAGGVYLSATQPTVDNADLGTGSQTLSAKQYPDSVTFGCDCQQGNGQPDEAFDVAGHSLFTAMVGIPDDASDATSLNETVVFANQAGAQLIKPLTVSLGHPSKVQLDITNVTQLEVTCSGTNTSDQQPDNNNLLTLGDAAVS